MSDQTPDEVTLIKCFNLDESAARLTPHIGFVDKLVQKTRLRGRVPKSDAWPSIRVGLEG